MDLRKVVSVALATVVFPVAGAVRADVAESDYSRLGVTEFALPSSSGDLAVEFVPRDSREQKGGTVSSGHGNGAVRSAVEWLPKPRVYDVRYRPRRERDFGRRSNYSSSVTQFHAGFYDPDGDQKSRFLAGMRVGPMLDPHVQIGLGVDWAHQGDRLASVTRRTIGPGGTPIEVRQDLARASSDFIPISAFLQISADDDMPIIPFFGVGGGYQLLLLSADDFTTGQSFDGTFGGWGWQVWGGAGLPLSGRTRLTGEVFVNGGELHREVDDPSTGQTYEETVDADGMGMKFGLAWGF